MMRQAFGVVAVALVVLVGVPVILGPVGHALAAPGRPGYGWMTGRGVGPGAGGFGPGAMAGQPGEHCGAMAEGKTLAQLAAEQGVSLEELLAVKLAAMSRALTDLVEAGRLNPEVAAAMQARMARHAEALGWTDTR